MPEIPETRTATPILTPITMINAFTVPLEESEEFLQLWKENAQIMAAQPGFVRARLHESLIDDAELRYVNVAAWESGVQLEEALARPEWQASAQKLLTLNVKARPSIYQGIIDVTPGAQL
ncbi:antibiotic biosynthesis monooxygenase family protein [Nocardia sp. NPDC051030]|uniref:antibiotic biosynthesis monooxygenase family protein n=1 Tax=Nocardia sp. NPDC051030 TaxID=3155162 RepID=UPI003434480F